MALCAQCGLEMPGPSEFCEHHVLMCGEGWAAGNKILCDFLHRGIVPPRLNAAERGDDFWATSTSETAA